METRQRWATAGREGAVRQRTSALAAATRCRDKSWPANRQVRTRQRALSRAARYRTNAKRERPDSRASVACAQTRRRSTGVPAGARVVVPLLIRRARLSAGGGGAALMEDRRRFFGSPRHSQKDELAPQPCAPTSWPKKVFLRQAKAVARATCETARGLQRCGGRCRNQDQHRRSAAL